MTSKEIVPRTQWEKGAIELAAQYAGFEDAADLTPEEQMQALATLVPVALEIVDEARDTIERVTNELNNYKVGEIHSLIQFRKDFWGVSIKELDNLTPEQLIQREKIDDLLKYVRDHGELWDV